MDLSVGRAYIFPILGVFGSIFQFYSFFYISVFSIIAKLQYNIHCTIYTCNISTICIILGFIVEL